MQVIDVPTFGGDKGSLSVIDRLLPFDIKRVFYIYGVGPGEVRGGHGHKKTIQALICVAGSCKVSTKVLGTYDTDEILLDSPTKCAILAPEDWHEMSDFKYGTVLLVISSEHHIEDDYIPAHTI